VRLDADLYPRLAVQRAMQAFASHVTLALSRDGRDHLVRFSGVTGEPAELVDEFANFVLGCLAEGSRAEE
jgi:hypothetical protein